MKRTNTKYFPKLIDSDLATGIYDYLRLNIKWEEGIRSKQGHTRLAKGLTFEDDEVVTEFVTSAMKKTKAMDDVITMGLYLNYQRNGNEYTPNHSHPKQVQFVICLGPATRTFIVGNKEYKVSNGDTIIFGSSIHGVPIEPEVKEGRISIATFSVRV